jgi:hypothetical protein
MYLVSKVASGLSLRRCQNPLTGQWRDHKGCIKQQEPRSHGSMPFPLWEWGWRRRSHPTHAGEGMCLSSTAQDRRRIGWTETEEQLERLGSLGETSPDVPNIQMGSPVDFFDDLCRNTDGGKTLPTWKGELYLELHRGVRHSSSVIRTFAC